MNATSTFRAECELAAVGTRPVGDDLAFLDAFADSDDRPLVDTGVLVRTLEFDQRIDVGRHLTRDRAVDLMVGLDDDAFGIDEIDDAVAFCDDDRARIACGDLFHSGTDIRRFGTKKRNRLTLHVRTHQGPVGVVVLEERDQRCGDRNELFRRNVHILDVRTVGRNEFALLPGGVSLVDEIAFFIELDVRLADDPFVLFPRGLIERKRFEFGLFPSLLSFALAASTSSSGTCHPV